MSERIFIGVAWPYASGSRHLGHLAGAYLPADIFARYHRTKGNEVLMVSGADEHGTPITIKAEQEGKTPSRASLFLPETVYRDLSEDGDFLRSIYSYQHRESYRCNPGFLPYPAQ